MRNALSGILLILQLCFVHLAAADDLDTGELTAMSLEELMNIEVTITARKPIRFHASSSAVFVITAEDIHRSGVTSIPEALRMVPGLQVAQIDANQWAISSRGFNGRFANKLLVLMDGRTVYTPSFSGVYWEVQDTLIEDIERIEVIRGPGATQWGVNAVNGVINIITKNAGETVGGMFTALAGNEEIIGGLRYGAKIGDDTYARIYVKQLRRDGFPALKGPYSFNESDIFRSGFRMDHEISGNDSLTLQGDIYTGDEYQVLSLPAIDQPEYTAIINDTTDLSGGNLLARWRHQISMSSDLALLIYFDRFIHEELTNREARSTFDIDFTHRFSLGDRNRIAWGLSYRFTKDDLDSSFFVAIDPEEEEDHLYSFFIQDDIMLIKDRLSLSLGSKFEDNDYTGFEIQPSARLLWTPDEHNSVWASVSRAVRVPSRIENNGRVHSVFIESGIPFFPAALIRIHGNEDLESEELLAYELGYRTLVSGQVYLDMALFYNEYADLRTGEPGEPGLDFSTTPPLLVFPFMVENMMEGEVFGAEVSVDWRPASWWKVSAAYSYVQMNLSLDSKSGDVISELAEGDTPHHQALVRSSMDLPAHTALDVWVRYVDDLPHLDVDSYTSLNLRLSWKPRRDLEFSIVGKNLLESEHTEFWKELHAPAYEVERSVFGKIVVNF